MAMTSQHELPLPGCRTILFVCMGNICRSPLAKGVFAAGAARRNVQDRFEIDSCGTGAWHAGENADPRTLMVARKYGIPLTHRARQLSPLYDFKRYDLVLAMDQRNMEDMVRVGAPSPLSPRVRLLREFDPAARAQALVSGVGALEVPDPYYGGVDGFDLMYQMIHAACEGLLDDLLRET